LEVEPQLPGGQGKDRNQWDGPDHPQLHDDPHPGPGPAGHGQLVDDPEQGRLAVADEVLVDGRGGHGQDAHPEGDPDQVAGVAAVAGPGQPGHQAARSVSVAVAAASSAGAGSRAGPPSSSRTRAPTATPRAAPPTMSSGRWAPTYMRVKKTAATARPAAQRPQRGSQGQATRAREVTTAMWPETNPRPGWGVARQRTVVQTA